MKAKTYLSLIPAFLLGCATAPPLPVDELIESLSIEVWPGFSPLDGNIAVYGIQGEQLITLCHGGDCDSSLEFVEPPENGAFILPGDPDNEYAFYPNLGLIETARLIAHEQFHQYQARAPEFFGIAATSSAPIGLAELTPYDVALVLAYREALLASLERQEKTCPPPRHSMNAALAGWVLQGERFEGLAQYIDLMYGMHAAQAGSETIKQILTRELRKEFAANMDILSSIWSTTYVTGAARAYLERPAVILNSHLEPRFCDPSSAQLDLARDLLAESDRIRERMSTKFERQSLRAVDVSGLRLSISASQRLYFPWGTAFSDADIYSSTTDGLLQLRDLKAFLSVRCEDNRVIALFPDPEGDVYIEDARLLPSTVCN